jgi:hypothetical protein
MLLCGSRGLEGYLDTVDPCQCICAFPTRVTFRSTPARARPPSAHTEREQQHQRPTSTRRNSTEIRAMNAGVLSVKSRRPGDHLIYHETASKIGHSRSVLSRRWRGYSRNEATYDTEQQALYLTTAGPVQCIWLAARMSHGDINRV